MTQSTTSNSNNISNTSIVFVIAPSGTGKTFTGDYLALMHGYKHVDGDLPLKNKHLPQYSDMVATMWKVACEYLPKNEDGPEEMWQPYFAELARLTLEAAETSEKVVLTHATYRQAWQEYVIQKLIEGGASPDQISMVALTIDEDVKLKGLYLRTKQFLESAGLSLEEDCRNKGWEGEGEMTCEEFASLYKKHDPLGSWIFQYPPAGTKSVDVSSRNLDALHAINEALDLEKPTVEENYEELVSRVNAEDAKRSEEFKNQIAKRYGDEKKVSEDESASGKEEKVSA